MKPGHEIDALVAEKVMGFRPGNSPNTWSNSDRINIPFNPSTDIRDAWEVVDRMKALTECNGERHSTRDPWQAFCKELNDHDDWFGEAFWYVDSQSICLAALKAVGAL
jgi:hypothetical protein